MEVLLAGNTGLVTKEFIRTAFPEEHVLVTHPPVPAEKAEEIDEAFAETLRASGHFLENLSETYEFEKLVYFSNYLSLHGTQEGELERLRHMLHSCRQNKARMIYLAGPEGGFSERTGKVILARAAEELCMQFAEMNDLQVKIIRMPYFYDVNAGGNAWFHQKFQDMEKGALSFSEPGGERCAFLNMDDLAVLLYRIFDNWTPEREILSVPDVFHLDFEKMGSAMAELAGKGVKLRFGTEALQGWPEEDRVLRERYGWFPRFSVYRDLYLMYDAWRAMRKKKQSWFRRAVDVLKSGGRAVEVLEIAALWMASEAAVRLTQTQAQFRVIDFRLLFVVLCGTMYGMSAGVAAAGLASFSLVLAYLRQGSSWTLLFYEPANWLGFIFYFVAGAVCGYTRLRNLEAARFLQKENALFKDRLAFVKKIYQNTLEDERQLKNQLLGRRDSFGKIYSITRQLDSVQPQKLYAKTVGILEEVLENHSIVIYSIGKNRSFGRLEAASAALGSHISKSIRLDGRAAILEQLEREGVWVNTQLEEGLPMYLAGVSENGVLSVLIELREASWEQMNLYYHNLFRILCGLVESALLRAFAYQDAVRAENYLPGTCILHEKSFAERLQTLREMKEAGMTDFVMLELTAKERLTPEEIGERLGSRIRENDIAGMAADGKVCLLMNQMSQEQIPLVRERFQAAGLVCTEIPWEKLREAAAYE